MYSARFLNLLMHFIYQESLNISLKYKCIICLTHHNTSLIIFIFVFIAGFDFAFERDFTQAAASLLQKKYIMYIWLIIYLFKFRKRECFLLLPDFKGKQCMYWMPKKLKFKRGKILEEISRKYAQMSHCWNILWNFVKRL